MLKRFCTRNLWVKNDVEIASPVSVNGKQGVSLKGVSDCIVWLAVELVSGETTSVCYQTMALPCSGPNGEIRPSCTEFGSAICGRHLEGELCIEPSHDMCSLVSERAMRYIWATFLVIIGHVIAILELGLNTQQTSVVWISAMVEIRKWRSCNLMRVDTRRLYGLIARCFCNRSHQNFLEYLHSWPVN